MSRQKLSLMLLAAATIVAFALPAAVSAAKPDTRGGATADLTGTFVDTVGGQGTFDGTFTALRATTVDGTAAVVGTVTGTLTDSLGNETDVTQRATFQIIDGVGTCQILELELGPLNLDLLGLEIFLDEVILVITANPAGGLLGQLLCAVANLLNGPTLGQALANLLNQILGLLRL